MDQPAEASASQRIFHAMLDRIRDGRWQVGASLPGERLLMEEFGVSRVPLREALSALRALGLVEIAHGRRSRIRQLDSEILACLFPLLLSLGGAESLRQVVELRLGLEPQCAAVAARERSAADLARLDAEVARLAEIDFTDANDQALLDADMAFHLAVAEATGNPLFPALLHALSGYYRFYISSSRRLDPDSRHRAVARHAAIVDAIRGRNADEAAASMRQHLQDSARGLFGSD